MNRKDAMQLIDAYFDDELSNADLHLFEKMLDEDQEFLKMFKRESRFHLRLSMGLATLSQAELAISNLDEAVMLDQQHSQETPLLPTYDTEGIAGNLGEVFRATIMNVIGSTRFLWAIMLFSMGLFLLMMFMLIPKDTILDGPNPFTKVTHVSQTVDAVWGKGTEEEDLKILFKGTKLDLRSGLAQVEYKNGVRVNLEGPTVFVISNENGGALLSGKVSAQMAEGVEKFSITTPTGKITDLGTEFGIIVDQQQNTDVQVFDGKVNLAVSGKRKNALPIQQLDLVETNAVRINAAERTVTKIQYTPLRFARSYKNLRPYYYDDFSTDTSDNYSVSFANGGANDNALAIDGGVLSLRTNADACSVISKRPLLGAGEIFMVDVPGIDPEVSEIVVTVSTQTTMPTTGVGRAFGFRLRREKGIVVEKFDSQVPPNGDASRGNEEIRIDDPLFGRPIRLVIERRTATDFVFYYESNDGRTRITDSISNPDLKNFNRLHVGVEARSARQEDTMIFDNLIIYPSEEP